MQNQADSIRAPSGGADRQELDELQRIPRGEDETLRRFQLADPERDIPEKVLLRTAVSVTTPDLIDDLVNWLQGDLSVHRREDPWGSPRQETRLEGKERAKGSNRCAAFLYGTEVEMATSSVGSE